MLKRIYLLAAIVGTIIPWVFFAGFIIDEGLDIPLFISTLFETGPAAGFTADLLISSFVFWVWAYTDAQQNNITRWWLVIPANLTVGLSLALPLYLYMREDARENL